VVSGELDGGSIGDEGMFSHNACPEFEDESDFRDGVEGWARYSDLEATSSREGLPVRDCVRSRLWLNLLDGVDEDPILGRVKDEEG
jgi:hypothetical protein